MCACGRVCGCVLVVVVVVWGGRGGGCIAVEAVLETRVVGRREGDHKLPREMHRLCKTMRVGFGTCQRANEECGCCV